MCLLAAISGHLYPEVIKFFGLAGTFICSIIGVIIPYYMALKIGYSKTLIDRYLILGLLILISILTLISMFFLIKTMWIINLWKFNILKNN